MLKIECEENYRHFSERLYSLTVPVELRDMIHLKAILHGDELQVSLNPLPYRPDRTPFFLVLNISLDKWLGKSFDRIDEFVWRNSSATTADFGRLHEMVEERMIHFHPVRYHDGEEWSRKVLEKLSITRHATTLL